MTETILSPEAYAFNPWAVPPALTALYLFGVSLHALFRPGRFVARTIGAIWAMCAAIWFGSAALGYSAQEAEVAFFWARTGMIGCIFLAPIGMNFADAFLTRRPTSGPIQTMAWLMAVFFAATAALTDSLVSGVGHFFWGFYPRFGTLGPMFIAYTLASFAWISIQHNFPRPGFQSSRADRSRRLAVRIGVLVANLAAIDMLAAFGWPVYPCGWLAMMGVVIGAQYANRRHGLWTVGHALQALQILDAINEGVLVVDEDFDVYFASRTANELFDRPQSAEFSLSAATNGVLTKSIHKRILSGDSMPLLETVIKQDKKEERTFAVSGSVARDARGLAVGVIYVFRDITDYTKTQKIVQSMQAHVIDVHRKARDEAENRLKQIEDKLVHTAKIDALGQMAGGVAHDFNNLLTAILGGCDLALRRLGAGHPVQRILAQVRSAGEQGAILTGQLLAYSRKRPLSPQLIDVNHAVKDATKLLERLIPENIDIVIRSEGTHSYASAEPGQLTQVLLNLAINARDAMPNGGRLTIRTYNVTQNSYGDTSSHGLHGPGEYVAISVEDTGCGMDDQTRRRVFDPFFTTKTEGKGTGLGLSTAYGMVRQIGGDILVESQLGKGSTFYVLLPVVETASTAEVIAPRSAMPFADHQTRILVVEDQAAVRNLVAEELSACGHQVLQASDGVEAVRILETEPEHIGLVLTDMVMPRMGGRELAMHIATHHPQTKVIAMSGYLGHDEMMDFQRLVSCILVKPFGQDKLLSTVEAVLADRGDQQGARSRSEKSSSRNLSKDVGGLEMQRVASCGPIRGLEDQKGASETFGLGQITGRRGAIGPNPNF